MRTNLIFVSKANNYKRKIVLDTIININEKLPRFNDPEEASIFYNKEAEEIFQALIGSLPKGTRTQLIIKLLDYQLRRKNHDWKSE